MSYKYQIKRRKALKIETLPAPEVRPIQNSSTTYSRYFIEKKERKITCVFCGQRAAYIAYFNAGDGAQQVEKYCQLCLDKWVIFDLDVPTISK